MSDCALRPRLTKRKQWLQWEPVRLSGPGVPGEGGRCRLVCSPLRVHLPPLHLLIGDRRARFIRWDVPPPSREIAEVSTMAQSVVSRRPRCGETIRTFPCMVFATSVLLRANRGAACVAQRVLDRTCRYAVAEQHPGSRREGTRKSSPPGGNGCLASKLRAAVPGAVAQAPSIIPSVMSDWTPGSSGNCIGGGPVGVPSPLCTPSRGSQRAVYAPVELPRRAIRYCSRSRSDDAVVKVRGAASSWRLFRRLSGGNGMPQSNNEHPVVRVSAAQRILDTMARVDMICVPSVWRRSGIVVCRSGVAEICTGDCETSRGRNLES
ncbi:hypothetical protein BC628DRAFT_1340044 [Trametes gibbosa]|nr:hypothetical protein BC628DRAFT_1340044 [Trametes gibbosa]